MSIRILHLRRGDELEVLESFTPSSTILDVKKSFYAKNPKRKVEQQMLKLSQERGAKALKDEETLESIGLGKGGVLYFKDLGPQIRWSTVFLCEYAGPLVVYLMFFLRPSSIYGNMGRKPMAQVVQIAAVCWTAHYLKRILETLFVHRFSHATMPRRNLIKNCSYYWGFAAFVSYFVNHPQYTPPSYGANQMYAGLALFVICELGNLSIHVALRNLRPAGTKERKVPYATVDPFTFLFTFVSCPNYTYEIGAWLGFSVMTQTLPALLFTIMGFLQMAQWAQGKHRNYRKEFPNYPRMRKAIIPFVF